MKAIYDVRYRDLIARLKGARNKAGLTQAEVATAMERCRTWVAKIEACELECGIMDLIGFCKVYGMRARDVVKEMEDA